MGKPQKREQRAAPALDWSNRILILSVAGILFLTLFPFALVFHSRLPGNASPFLLQSGMKGVGALDDVLNVLLFIPFGFGLAEKLRQRGMSRGAAFLAALASGAMLSYGIEFLQNYVPSRDAGWHDVLTNTAGSVIGFALFELAGGIAVRLLSAAERFLAGLLSFRRAVWIVPLYFILWFAASAHLQQESQPSNWDPNCSLVVGNTAAGRPASGWSGEINRLEVWHNALADDLAARLTAGDQAAIDSPGPAGDYRLTGKAPFPDQKGLLPELAWKSNGPQASNGNSIFLDGRGWLTSVDPVPDLVTEIQGTKQFSVRVVCTAADVVGIDKRIVSISRASGLIDLDLRQDDANLVFWFRNPISVRHALLAWYIPNVFAPHQTRNILFSYDGANLALYINGQREGRKYSLGPGTALARLLRRVKPSELEAYRYVYYALLFFPGGILLGIAFRQLDPASAGTIFFLGSCFLLPPLLLEIMLVHVSGRGRSVGALGLGLCLTVGGSLWINADRNRVVETNGRSIS